MILYIVVQSINIQFNAIEYNATFKSCPPMWYLHIVFR